MVSGTRAAPAALKPTASPARVTLPSSGPRPADEDDENDDDAEPAAWRAGGSAAGTQSRVSRTAPGASGARLRRAFLIFPVSVYVLPSIWT